MSCGKVHSGKAHGKGGVWNRSASITSHHFEHEFVFSCGGVVATWLVFVVRNEVNSEHKVKKVDHGDMRPSHSCKFIAKLKH